MPCSGPAFDILGATLAYNKFVYNMDMVSQLEWIRRCLMRVDPLNGKP